MILFLFYIGIGTLSVLLFKLWVYLVPVKLIPIGIIIILTAFIGGYFLWIYLLAYGFDKLDTLTQRNVGIRKLKIVLIISFTSYVIGYISFSEYFIVSQKFYDSNIINI